MSRIQYSHEKLREIEKAVQQLNPKRFLRPTRAMATPAGTVPDYSAPPAAADAPARRGGRFERPAGYQGRLGRDRDNETFEEGFQYELTQRQLNPSEAPAHQPKPSAWGQPAASSAKVTPVEPAPAAPVVPIAPAVVAPVATPAPAPPSEFDDLAVPIPIAGARKSRFNFADSTPAPAVHQQQPVAAAAPLPVQPKPTPPQPTVVHQPQSHTFQVVASSHHHADPTPGRGMHHPQVPVHHQPAPAPAAVQHHQNVLPHARHGTAPAPASLQQGSLASFTVQASSGTTPTNPPTAKPHHQQPQTASGELDVVAALKRFGVDTAKHTTAAGGQQQQHHTQHQPSHGARGGHIAHRGGGVATRPSHAAPTPASAMPPDPAIVAFSSQQSASAGPPALQMLFNNAAARPASSGVSGQGAFDATALEASLMNGGQQQRPVASSNFNGGRGYNRRR